MTITYCKLRTPLRCWQFQWTTDIPLWVAPFLQVDYKNRRVEFQDDNNNTCPMEIEDWLVEFCEDNVDIFTHFEFQKEFELCSS